MIDLGSQMFIKPQGAHMVSNQPNLTNRAGMVLYLDISPSREVVRECWDPHHGRVLKVSFGVCDASTSAAAPADASAATAAAADAAAAAAASTSAAAIVAATAAAGAAGAAGAAAAAAAAVAVSGLWVTEEVSRMVPAEVVARYFYSPRHATLMQGALGHATLMQGALGHATATASPVLHYDDAPLQVPCAGASGGPRTRTITKRVWRFINGQYFGITQYLDAYTAEEQVEAGSHA